MPRTTTKSKSVSPAVTSEIRDVPPEAIADVRNEAENLKRPGKPSVQVAKFSKVSFEQFCADIEACGLAAYTVKSVSHARALYDAIRLPTRATSGSAGYDICTPIPFTLSNLNAAPQGFTFPTGIRCEMNPSYVMLIIPKSGLGFRHYTRLGNTIGCVDAGVYYA